MTKNISIKLGSNPQIAVVRFSALGDVVLVSEAVRQLRVCMPNAAITWITSPLTYSLFKGMEGVNFEVFDKPRSLQDYVNFYRAFKLRHFDVVLAMQANLRINLLYPSLRAPIKIGFDRTRAREGQWLFCNQAIPYKNEHLLDSFFSFKEMLGCTPQPASWEIPLLAADTEWAHSVIDALPRPLIAIHPCASKAERNWPIDRWESVIRLAKERWGCGFVFTGGTSALELDTCATLIKIAGDKAVNLCGRTTSKQLAALLESVDAVIAPDTAAIHIARAMNTPVIGLYAVASPTLSGPYQQTEFIVDRHQEGIRRFLNLDPQSVKWNTRVHHPDAMKCIQVDDVLNQLSKLLAR